MISRFEELLGKLLDDELDAKQIAELVALASDDAEKQEELLLHLNLSDRLSQYEDELRGDGRFLDALTSRIQTTGDSDNFVQRMSASACRIESQPEPAGANASRVRSSGWLVAGMAATLAIVLLLLFNRDRSPDENEPTVGHPTQGASAIAAADEGDPAEQLDIGVAVLARRVNMQGSDAASWQSGATLPPGVLKWEAGILQLDFYKGVTVVGEGPASIELVDESQLICREGKLRIHVPEGAVGFVVRTPSVEVVDRGTEFGVEVEQSGATSVHVFEGRVEIFKLAEGREGSPLGDLGAGDAVSIGVDGHTTSIAAHDAEFTTLASLDELIAAEGRHQFKRWQQLRNQLVSDPRVIAYFPFDRDTAKGRTLIGYDGSGDSLRGAIVGCEWSEGRWPEKSSLDFKRPGDRVRIDLPGDYESLTYAAWVRVDGLDREFSSLLLTDGFQNNRPHWQFNRRGCLLVGLRHPGTGLYSYQSTPVLDKTQLGGWIHVATVIDSKALEVRHYANGVMLSREPLRESSDRRLTLGSATIGNWGQPTKRHQAKIRNLNGRIDELMVFNTALPESEIRQIYASGRP